METQTDMTESSPMFKGYFDSYDGMDLAYYGVLGDAFGKANAPVQFGTTGVRNVLYSSIAMAQISVGANTLGALPKWTWEKSGFRAITTAGSTASAGQAEYSGSQALPDSLKPAWLPVDVNPKLLSAKIEMSSQEVALSGKDDTVLWQDYQDYMMREFKNRINRGILTDFDTLAGTNIESIDRMTSSTAEQTAVSATAGDEDPWTTIDRSAQSWADSMVAHNSNVDRVFGLSVLDGLISSCRPYWDNPASVANKIILTGVDMGERIQQQINSQVKYAPMKVQFGANGVQTLPGIEAGINVASYKDMPVIQDNFVFQDTLSRAYVLDLDHIAIQVLTPVDYRESDDYLLLNKYAKTGLMTMQGELVCNLFKSCGKARDFL
jgi:hypothetical protein